MTHEEQDIVKHLEQPGRLPKGIYEQIPGEVLSYGLVDLNEQLELVQRWLVLTNEKVYLFDESRRLWDCHRSRIKSSQLIEGTSSQKLRLELDQEDVHEFRFSLRQSRNIAVVQFLIEDDVSAVDIDPDKIYQSKLLESVSGVSAKGRASASAVFWRLAGYLKPYKRSLYLGFGAVVLKTIVSLVPAFATGYIVDRVIKPFEMGALTKEQAFELFWLGLTVYAVSLVLREGFMWVRLNRMSILGEYVARDLRNQAYEHLHRLSMGYFAKRQTGSLISRVGADTDRIWDFVAFGIVEVTTSVMLLIGLSAVLLFLDWRLGLVVSVPVPIYLWLIYRHGENMHRLFSKAWKRWSDLTDCLSGTIPGIQVVKAFNKSEAEVERFKERNRAVVGEFNRIHSEWTSFWPRLMLLLHAMVVAVWVLGVPRILQAQDLTLGTFVSFVLYLTMFAQPIETIGQMARMVNRATSSAHRVFEILDTEPGIVDSQGAKQMDGLKGAVEFDQVSFSYDGVRKVVKNVSFKIQPGEMIGLVGTSGSGKTTVTQLLTKFYLPQSGQIRIDGYPLQDFQLDSFRRHVGMVLQEAYLFHGSLLDNIRYGNESATLSEVIAAARAANAHEFIAKLPLAYDTIVGERGHNLSGGERQRISIARAILRDPKLLILDEATSAVDTETERKIQQALDRLVQGRTVIAIAHRLSTLANADRLLVMKDGRLIEEGHHEDLMKDPNGQYRKLIEMQMELSGAEKIVEKQSPATASSGELLIEELV
ncbi:MAG: ABC transporter [Bdellovibrionaceae bacterium]|nr:ABC transporter [Pseudobdellovibrionaceae bacterium]